MILIPANLALQPAHTVPIKKEEAREQARLVACLRYHWSKIFDDNIRPIIFHIANGGSRDAREASNLKVQGVLAGVPDLCIVLPEGRMMWVEMKAAEGRVSKAQTELHEHFAELGHRILVAYSAEEALDKLREVLNG